MSDTWCHGLDGYGSCDYGMGLNNEVIDKTAGEGQVFGKSRMIGHGGANWGTTTGSCGYNPEYKFGICIAFASGGGLSRRLNDELSEWGPPNVACSVYDAVMAAIGGQRVPSCAAWPRPQRKRPFVWTKDKCDVARNSATLTPSEWKPFARKHCNKPR